MAKKSSGGGSNWMDTYGDMVTLLLCFFVLLYSMSSITEEKWIKLVESFNPDGIPTPTEMPFGDGSDPNAPNSEIEATQPMIDIQMENLYEMIEDMIEAQSQQNNMSVTKDGGRIYISFNQVVFFDGDSPVLKKEAEGILTEVAAMFDDMQNCIDEIRVLGHTAQADPNKANSVRTDRTLASMRATNVVIFIQENSTIDPAKLISEGIGQWRPVDSNSTEVGRSHNRRVEMIVSGRNIEQEMADGILKYPSAQ